MVVPKSASKLEFIALAISVSPGTSKRFAVSTRLCRATRPRNVSQPFEQGRCKFSNGPSRRLLQSRLQARRQFTYARVPTSIFARIVAATRPTYSIMGSRLAATRRRFQVQSDEPRGRVGNPFLFPSIYLSLPPSIFPSHPLCLSCSDGTSQNDNGLALWS